MNKSLLNKIALVAMVVVISAGASFVTVRLVVSNPKDDIAAAYTQADTANDLAELNRDSIKDIKSDMDDIKRGVSASLEKNVRDIKTVLSQTSQSELKWVKNPSTGHSYALVPYCLPWHLAAKYAVENGGYLVAIDDDRENAWLVKAFGSEVEYWIGLTDEKKEGQWVWMNGQKFDFKNWLSGEPDNYRNSQHYVFINSKVPHRNLTISGKWNDASGNEPRVGIIERDR